MFALFWMLLGLDEIIFDNVITPSYFVSKQNNFVDCADISTQHDRFHRRKLLWPVGLGPPTFWTAGLTKVTMLLSHLHFLSHEFAAIVLTHMV